MGFGETASIAVGKSLVPWNTLIGITRQVTDAKNSLTWGLAKRSASTCMRSHSVYLFRLAKEESPLGEGSEAASNESVDTGS